MSQSQEPLDPKNEDPNHWAQGAGWALLLSRWLAAQLVRARLSPVRKFLGILTAAAIPLYGIAFLVDPNWPWLILGTMVLVTAGFAFALVSLIMLVITRLALPKRAKPLEQTLSAARENVSKELASVGAPVSIGAGIGFVLRLATGRSPQAGMVERLRGLVGRLDEVLDTDEIRRTLSRMDGSAEE